MHRKILEILAGALGARATAEERLSVPPKANIESFMQQCIETGGLEEGINSTNHHRSFITAIETQQPFLSRKPWYEHGCVTADFQKMIKEWLLRKPNDQLMTSILVFPKNATVCDILDVRLFVRYVTEYTLPGVCCVPSKACHKNDLRICIPQKILAMEYELCSLTIEQVKEFQEFARESHADVLLLIVEEPLLVTNEENIKLYEYPRRKDVGLQCTTPNLVDVGLQCELQGPPMQDWLMDLQGPPTQDRLTEEEFYTMINNEAFDFDSLMQNIEC